MLSWLPAETVATDGVFNTVNIYRHTRLTMNEKMLDVNLMYKKILWFSVETFTIALCDNLM